MVAVALFPGLLTFWLQSLAFQLLMCGTGDISVCDFKAHAVVVGGSWHFREKVSERVFPSFLLKPVIPPTAEDNLKLGIDSLGRN